MRVTMNFLLSCTAAFAVLWFLAGKKNRRKMTAEFEEWFV